jgi:hypothetical protein
MARNKTSAAWQSKVKNTVLQVCALFISPTVKQVSFYYPIFSWIASHDLLALVGSQ